MGSRKEELIGKIEESGWSTFVSWRREVVMVLNEDEEMVFSIDMDDYPEVGFLLMDDLHVYEWVERNFADVLEDLL